MKCVKNRKYFYMDNSVFGDEDVREEYLKDLTDSGYLDEDGALTDSGKKIQEALKEKGLKYEAARQEAIIKGVSLEEKQEIVASTLARLEKLREMKRIKGYEEEFRPVWHFFDLKSYIIMAVMICGGIWLRASGLAPDVFIAVFYTGLGCALALAGVLFWIMFLLFREKSNDNS